MIYRAVLSLLHYNSTSASYVTSGVQDVGRFLTSSVDNVGMSRVSYAKSHQVRTRKSSPQLCDISTFRDKNNRRRPS